MHSTKVLHERMSSKCNEKQVRMHNVFIKRAYALGIRNNIPCSSSVSLSGQFRLSRQD